MRHKSKQINIQTDRQTDGDKQTDDHSDRKESLRKK